MLSDKQRAELRERIAQRTAELTVALQEAEAAAQTVELDQTRLGRLSRMDAMQGQEMAKAASQRMQRELTVLNAAVLRLEELNFGDCEACSEPIAYARLLFSPGVRLCIACAEQAEFE